MNFRSRFFLITLPSNYCNMKKVFFFTAAFLVFAVSCSGPANRAKGRIITVSIPPFRYFVEAIADSDFTVNVMLPPGADHHTWEPLPAQISALAKSDAFLTDGYLGFESAWMNRFREINPAMKISDLARGINLIKPLDGDHTDTHDEEGADPHYWMSPKEAYVIAANARDILKELNPPGSSRYESNYLKLIARIASVDTVVTRNLRTLQSRSFLIYHPALSYLARDYSLEQLSFENEGKEPSPSGMKRLVDMAEAKGIKVILVQAEYDTKNAMAIAGETGTRLFVINPMNPDWEKSVIGICEDLNTK